MKSIISSSVLSGIAIGTAGFGYLASGKDIVGAVLFAFGLATVVHYSLKLYTGTAGFIRRGELGTLFLILFFNLVGCALMGLMARCSPLPLQETAQGYPKSRLLNLGEPAVSFLRTLGQSVYLYRHQTTANTK